MVINIGKRSTEEVCEDGLQERVEGLQGSEEKDSFEEAFWEVSEKDIDVATLLYEAFKPLWGC